MGLIGGSFGGLIGSLGSQTLSTSQQSWMNGPYFSATGYADYGIPAVAFSTETRKKISEEVAKMLAYFEEPSAPIFEYEPVAIVMQSDDWNRRVLERLENDPIFGKKVQLIVERAEYVIWGERYLGFAGAQSYMAQQVAQSNNASSLMAAFSRGMQGIPKPPITSEPGWMQRFLDACRKMLTS